MSITLEGINNIGYATKQVEIEGPYLSTLPSGFLPFEEFEKEFALGGTSTEQLNPITKSLSQTMHKNIPEGLELLLKVDEKVIEGLQLFIPSIEKLAPELAERIGQGGRIFLVGSGSSARVGGDIAAKCSQAFPKAEGQIRGVIAGGDSAFIRAKEGFEDSESDGMKALESHDLGPKDTVILISASGSASFNVGCGHYSADRGAHVLYFYNSASIPSRTQQLFDRKKNPVTPFCIDIGPQAIAGSTRLQGASFAEVGLGSLLSSALYLCQGEEVLAREYPKEVLAKMSAGIKVIRDHLKGIERFVKIEEEVFSDPRSNFRQLRDLSDQGYVTFLALKDSIREVLIDATETSPTFSTNPLRREADLNKKRAEFRTYLVGNEGDNQKAWKALLGREVDPADIKDVEAFLLASEAAGLNSYEKRPKGKGNFVIGVMKLDEQQPFSKDVMTALKAAKNEGGQTGLILICRGKLTEDQAAQLRKEEILFLAMENVPHDPIGISETMILKQMLNLISNGSMLLMNKVYGNQMIDVRASNRKLIDRSSRLIKEIWSEYQPSLTISDKVLYHYIAHVSLYKKEYEEKGTYTPSVVKIILTMLALKKMPKDFQEIVNFLGEKQERIDWIGEYS